MKWIGLVVAFVLVACEPTLDVPDGGAVDAARCRCPLRVVSGAECDVRGLVCAENQEVAEDGGRPDCLCVDYTWRCGALNVDAGGLDGAIGGCL